MQLASNCVQGWVLVYVWLDGQVPLGKVVVFDPWVLARVLDYNESGWGLLKRQPEIQNMVEPWLQAGVLVQGGEFIWLGPGVGCARGSEWGENMSLGLS